MTMKAKKMIMKSLAIFMVVCTFVQLCSISFAEGAKKENNGFTEIIVENDVDGQKAKAVADFINGEKIVTPRGSILCIFGHNLVEITIVIIEHEKYPTAPRCLETTYKAYYCSRELCDYISVTELTPVRQRRIYCCP